MPMMQSCCWLPVTMALVSVRFMFVWCCTILLLLAALGTEAHRADGMDLAVGTWNVSMHTNNPSQFFFPLRIQTLLDDEDKNNNKNKSMRFSPRIQIVPRLFHRSSLNCNIWLLPDGTFFMKPQQQEQQQHQDKVDDHGDGGNKLLYLRGRWKLEKSPYCATDRFFDVLHLQSYPQVALDATSGRVWHRRSLTLHTRLYGHYSRTPDNVPPRMVRGVCVLLHHDEESPLDQDDDDNNTQHQKSRHHENPSETAHLKQQRPVTLPVRLSKAWGTFWSQRRPSVVASFTATKSKL